MAAVYQGRTCHDACAVRVLCGVAALGTRTVVRGLEDGEAGCRLQSCFGGEFYDVTERLSRTAAPVSGRQP